MKEPDSTTTTVPGDTAADSVISVPVLVIVLSVLVVVGITVAVLIVIVIRVVAKRKHGGCRTLTCCMQASGIVVSTVET